MNFSYRKILSVVIATLWISLSEFVRNEFLLKGYWIKHYESLGLVFPDKPLNGAIWGLWSFLFATTIFIISRKFSLIHTTGLSWFVGFVLMWVVVGNMGVLPVKILYFAAPLSLFEAFIAAFIIVRLTGSATSL